MKAVPDAYKRSNNCAHDVSGDTKHRRSLAGLGTALVHGQSIGSGENKPECEDYHNETNLVHNKTMDRIESHYHRSHSCRQNQ